MVIKKKIQLINAPLEDGIRGVGNVECFPPTGLVSLSSYVNKKSPGHEMEILDGGIKGIDYVKENLDKNSLVAVSALSPTYRSALEILKTAKEKGATTLIGGHHTYNLSREIMKNRPYIDYLIKGDNAEKGFNEFIEYLEGKRKICSVSSLSYRQGKEILENKFEQLELKDIPIMDRSIISNPEEYYQNYMAHFWEWHKGKWFTGKEKIRPAVTKNAQGCKRGAVKRCIYCNIPDMSFRKKETNQFWNELVDMKEKYGINFVFETADSFSSFAKIKDGNSNYLENLVKSRPKDLDTELFVFSRADEITPQMIQYFKEMNVKRVNMGLDSGDNEMLKTGITKGTTSVDTNWNAVRQLHDAKIQMYVSFVLGGIGESEKSLENTYNFARDLVKYDHVVVVDPSPLLPLPGAPSWKFVKDKFQGQDLIDTEKAAKIWTERMCKVDWKTLKEYNSKIKNLAIENNRILGGYGIKNV